MEKSNIRNRPEQNSRALKKCGTHRRGHSTSSKSPQGNNFNGKGKVPANLKPRQEIVLDHTSLDVVLQEHSKEQTDLRRPWVTVIIDRDSREILSSIVSYEEVSTQ
jgi:hypothetical protein